MPPLDLDALTAASAPPTPVTDWFTITAAATEEGTPTRALVRIYDTIGGWYGTNAAEFVGSLDLLDVDELEVHLNSPGGAVWDGVAIMNALKQHRARVRVIVDGLAASAATIVAMAGDEIVMAEGSQMMIHRASGGAWGNAELMREMAAVLDKIDGNMAGIYARRAGGTRDAWLEVMTAETWYDAAEAVAAGLADRTDTTLEADDAEARFDLSVFAYAGRSKAPAPRILDRPLAQQLAAGGWPTQWALKPAAQATTPQAPVSSEPGHTNRKESDMSDKLKAGICERLGVTDAATLDDDGVLAALDEVLAEQANDTPTASAEPVIPQGTVLVDSAQFEALQRQAAEGEAARKQQTTERRDRLVEAALADGRIAAKNRDTWRAQLDENETVTASLLASLPPNTAVPVAEVGDSGGIEASSDDAEYARFYPTATSKEA